MSKVKVKYNIDDTCLFAFDFMGRLLCVLYSLYITFHSSEILINTET